MTTLNDQEIIKQLGLAEASAEEQKNTLVFFYGTVQSRVGNRIEQQLSNEQLSQFKKFADSKDDKGALQWLKDNAPGYDSVVQEEMAKLMEEVKSGAKRDVENSEHQQI